MGVIVGHFLGWVWVCDVLLYTQHHALLPIVTHPYEQYTRTITPQQQTHNYTTTHNHTTTHIHSADGDDTNTAAAAAQAAGPMDATLELIQHSELQKQPGTPGERRVRRIILYTQEDGTRVSRYMTIYGCNCVVFIVCFFVYVFCVYCLCMLFVYVVSLLFVYVVMCCV